MEFLSVSPQSLLRAADILRSGGLAAFPTETVYGLGADAYNSSALVKIFEAKGRPRFDPLIIHIADVKTLEEAANLSLLSDEARKKLFLLAENLWPGPLSIVLPKSEKIPGIATSGLSTAAFRFPDHETAQTLISLSGGAVAAPSANPFGSLSPTRAEHVRDKLGDKVDIILDGGPTRIGLESTVLDITGEKIKILRPGGTPKEAIEKLTGAVESFFTAAEAAPDAPLTAPGQLKSHYAPRTPLSVFSREEIKRQPYKESDHASQGCHAKHGLVFLFFDGSTRDAWLKEQGSNDAAVRVLSNCGNISEAAACLFETLHELDGLGGSRIIAQFAPQEGLGEAINDRLRRASVL
jgi:L-threonylcarbamoyladenylate synthase